MSRHLPAARMGSVIAFAATLLAARNASAETYVETPALAHAHFGAALHVRSGLALPSDAQSFIGGFGVDTYFDYEWETGWLVGGYAGWSHWTDASPLFSQLRDSRHGEEVDGGLTLRKVLWNGDVAPFLSLSFGGGWLHATGNATSDALAMTAAAGVGVRSRGASAEWYVGLYARTSRYEGARTDGSSVAAHHAELSVGAAFDLGLR